MDRDEADAMTLLRLAIEKSPIHMVTVPSQLHEVARKLQQLGHLKLTDMPPHEVAGRPPISAEMYATLGEVPQPLAM